MRSRERKNKGGFLAKALWVLLVLLLAAMLFVVYSVIPGEVAESIVARSQVRQPITETPRDYGIKNFQDVSFVTDDGVKISGWWLPAVAKKNPWAPSLCRTGFLRTASRFSAARHFYRN